jgi:hypothetical protein
MASTPKKQGVLGVKSAAADVCTVRSEWSCWACWDVQRMVHALADQGAAEFKGDECLGS